MELLKYDGYILEDAPHGYKSKINGEELVFDTASQWKKFIDYGKGIKKSSRI